MPNSSLISDKLARVAPSATMAVTQAAREMKAAGIDVIALGAGEPDFDTPEHIKEAGIKAIKDGQTNYTNVDGTPEFKDAIIAKFERDNNLSYTRSQISVAPGGKPVIFNALMASLSGGDEVIIPTPCWVSYPEMVKLCGGEPVLVPCDMESGFKITPAQLRAAITPQTKWLMLNSPSNPTGAAYSAAELRALADVLEAAPQVLILTDDIYEHLVYDGFEFATIAQVAPALAERTLTMNGLSKAYAMTGWRIGYAGGPQWLIGAMAKVMGQSTSNPCSISQVAGVAALNGPHDFIAQRNEAFTARRNAVVAGLNAIEGISCALPDGAFYVYPNCERLLGRTSAGGARLKSDTDFCQALIKEAHVAVVPGSAFHGAPHFRISYATSLEQLEQACARIKAFCEGLS